VRWLFAGVLVLALLCLQTVSAQTPISGCTDIASSGYYYLTQNLTGLKSGANYCIKITAKNVTLDGNGYSLTGSGTGYGVYISVSSVGNVTLKNLTISGYERGIYLSSTVNSTIKDSVLQNNKYGIYLYSSSNNTIANVTANNNGDSGLYLYSSSKYNTITNVTANNNYYYGIYIYSSSNNNTIVGSSFSNNGDSGIYIESSGYNTITSTTVSYNGWEGIYLYSSNNNKIIGSNLSNNFDSGIFTDSSNYNTITNVTANNNYAGIYLAYSSYNTITNVTAINNDEGVYLYSSSNYNTIANVVVSSDEPKEGIILDTSLNSTIKDSILQNSGLYVFDSHNNTVTNTTVNGKPLVYLEGVQDYEVNESTNAGQVVLVNCRNVTVRNLDLSNTTVGVELLSSERIRVENIVANNNIHGIYLGSSSNSTITNVTANNNNRNGIYLHSSSNNTIANVTANNNGDSGLFLYSFYSSSNNNTITNVTAYNNRNGLFLESASNNLIYNNYFNNTNNVAIYGILPNTWNITKTEGKNIVGGNFLGGNYWGSPDGNGFSDTCYDSDGDKICDQPYVIDDNNIDYLPLTKAPPPPQAIVTCRNITSPEYYYLTGNLTDLQSGQNYCIGIFANDVIIEGNGYSLIGPGYGYGVYVSASNVTLKNLTVSGYTWGIYLASSSNSTIANVTTNGNYYGIYLASSNNNFIANVTTNGNGGIGIYLGSSNNNTIIGSNISNNGWEGIRLESASNNLIYNNYFNNTNYNVDIPNNQPNTWNITKTEGKNIVGGNYLGGNYWGNPNGNGFSDTCYANNGDSDYDGICDYPFVISSGNIDYLPLVRIVATPPTPEQGWRYYRPLTIVNNVAQDLTDYQIHFTLDTARLIAQGKMRSNCGDIRVVLGDWQTFLPYWVEPNTCNTNNTRIWAKVPLIPAISAMTIYLLYGNPTATSESNASATFYYYDDGSLFSTWTQGTYACINDFSEGNPPPSYKCPSALGYYMYKDINLTPNMVVFYNVKTDEIGDFYFLVNSTGAGQMCRAGISFSIGFAETSNWTSWGSPSTGEILYKGRGYWYRFAIVIEQTSASLYYSSRGDTQVSPAIETFINRMRGTYAITNNGGYIGLVGDAFSEYSYTWWDNIIVRKYVSPEPSVSVGAEQILGLQIPDAVRVKVQYLDTGTISYYSIPITVYLNQDRVYNVSASLDISGVNPSYGANITVELLSKITLTDMSYNNSSVSYTYLGQNTSNSRVYSVYNFTTTANGTLIVNGAYANRAWDTVVKIDRKVEAIPAITAVLGENVEIVLPVRSNITLPNKTVLTNVTSFNFNTRSFGIGVKPITFEISSPESDDYGSLTISINTVYANRTVTVLDKDGEVVSGVGIYAYNIDTNDFTPANAIVAGNNSIQVFFRDMKLAETPAFYVNHTNLSDSFAMSILSKLLPTDYKNANKRIYAQKDFNITVLDAKVSRFAINLTEPSYVYIDLARNFSRPQLILNNCSLVSYTFPYAKLYCSGNATVVEGYILTLQVKDALGRAIDIVFALDNESLSSNRGIATITKPVGNYSLRLPAESFGFKLKTNATYSITLENDTSITAVYKVPVKIESREVRIEKRYPFPYPFLPFGTQETGNVGSVAKFKLEGSVIDYFGAPVPNRNVIIEIKAVGGATTYANTTTDSSGNFVAQANFTTNTTYMITYTLPEDSIYVGTSSVKTLTYEAIPLPTPTPSPIGVTISITVIFAVIILATIIAVVAVARSARRKTAKQVLEDMNEFRFFRRVR
jgi:parallel beta-helix repeat protein